MTNYANYGFILIDTDEKRKKFQPLLPNDQFLSGSGWIETYFAGQSMGGATYRRPIDPGEGYEIVPLDDASPRNTEATRDGSHWVVFGDFVKLKSVREALMIYLFSDYIAFRRKKQESAPLSVQMLSNAAKELLDRIAAGAGHYTANDFKCNESRILAALIDWKSPKTSDQIAYEKWKHGADGECLCLEEAFKAGAQYARKS